MTKTLTRADLATDLPWIRGHVTRACGRRWDHDELVSQGHDFILTRYNLESFDPTRYEGQPDAKIEQKLRAHAGISLIRHLRLFLRRERRTARQTQALPCVEAPVYEEVDETIEVERQRQDELLTKIGLRLDFMDDPMAWKLSRVISGIRGGSSLEDMIAETCPTRNGAAKLFAWASETFHNLNLESLYAAESRSKAGR